MINKPLGEHATHCRGLGCGILTITRCSLLKQGHHGAGKVSIDLLHKLQEPRNLWREREGEKKCRDKDGKINMVIMGLEKK